MSINRIRRHALVAALALAGGGLPVCAATISGVAADRDGRPIKRVTVTIDSLQPSRGIYKTSSTTTDENGRYAFEDFGPGAYALHAAKEGWVSADRHRHRFSSNRR